jgi:GTP-binding protein
MKFLDEATIHLKSGDGGNGCCSFRREKYVEFGGPNGGDGGKGGDIIFVADDQLNTLVDFRYAHDFKGENGRPGEGKNCTGAGGADRYIYVPVGTQILDEAGETILADFNVSGQTLTYLKGGDGGLGNTHFKSSTNQAPRKTTPGLPGAEATVRLRLKLIADVGLIGLPNAGKSTFLSCCSRARPKVADYPFTTTHPHLGVVSRVDRSLVIADIPGLIEGAHEGRGLGDRFLRHIERTSVLLHLVDITADDPAGDYATVRDELARYEVDMSIRPEIVALTKADALDADFAEELRADFHAKTGIDAYIISAISGYGVDKLLQALTGEIPEKSYTAEQDRDVEHSTT